MTDMIDPVPLPPGWDARYDPRTSRYYFVNYHTKTTTWEDPRTRYQQIQNQAVHRVSISGMGDCIPLQELKSSPKANRNVRIQQETNLTQTPDTEQLVSKIGSMFPTVSENHIRLLLKKYYNREAVVMSALQVEKHPITTPGPYSTPPPPIKHFSPNLQQTATTRGGGSPIPRPGSGSSGGTFIGSPRFGEALRSSQLHSSPKPHSSPKMKLRYMKSIFPSVEETILLDVLASNENNVQKASEMLLEMGYEKKDMKPPRLQQQNRSADEKNEIQIPLKSKDATPLRIKTVEEKAKIKTQLQKDYPAIPEPVINLALESVNYDTDRANQILQIMVQEDSKPRKSSSESTPEVIKKTDIKDTIAIEATPPVSKTPERSPKKQIIEKEANNKTCRNKNKNGCGKVTREFSIESELDIGKYQSICLIKAKGPNSELPRGPTDDLLLAEYTTWNGANPNLAHGKNPTYVKGPNKSLLQHTKSYQAKGPNSENRKGPIFGLAKGSIYAQLKSILCESRGK